MSRSVMEDYVDPADVLPRGAKPEDDFVNEEDVLPRGQKPQGSVHAAAPKPPTEQLRSILSGARSVAADAAMAPSQLVAGFADLGNETARRLGLPGANDARMSQTVAALRNQLAGRPGTEPGPATGFVQGLATSPMVGPGFAKSMLYGFGIGSGLANKNENPIVEGAKTAAITAPLSFLGGAFGKSKAPSGAEAELRAISKRENIPMLYGTYSNSPMMREAERRAERNLLLGLPGSSNYAQAKREAIDDKFAEALWRKVGKDYKEFTSTTIDDTFKEIGKKLDAPFAGKAISFRSPQLIRAEKDANALAQGMKEPTFLLKAREAVTDRMNKGQINSSEMNVMMADLRYFAKKAYDDGNKTAGDAIGNLMKAAREQAISNIPTQAGKDSYRRALTEYANMNVIADVFVKSKESARGNIDYSKLKSAVESSMPMGYARGRADLADLAKLGEAMRPGGVLPEGMKWSPSDPFFYMLFNNPLAQYSRSKGPVSSGELTRLLRAYGVQKTTPDPQDE